MLYLRNTNLKGSENIAGVAYLVVLLILIKKICHFDSGMFLKARRGILLDQCFGIKMVNNLAKEIINITILANNF